jgi:hypothetical protein
MSSRGAQKFAPVLSSEEGRSQIVNPQVGCFAISTNIVMLLVALLAAVGEKLIMLIKWASW